MLFHKKIKCPRAPILQGFNTSSSGRCNVTFHTPPPRPHQSKVLRAARLPVSPVSQHTPPLRFRFHCDRPNQTSQVLSQLKPEGRRTVSHISVVKMFPTRIANHWETGVKAGNIRKVWCILLYKTRPVPATGFSYHLSEISVPTGLKNPLSTPNTQCATTK